MLEIKHLVSYGLARRCVWIRMLFDAQNICIWLRMDWQGVAYGLACCLMVEIKHLVAYGLARRCVWIGMLFDG